MDIDQDLASLLESGVAIVVGTRDGRLAPEVSRAWGARALPEERVIELCVGLPSGRRTLDNLADNGQVAVTFVRPSDYRQVQLKGRLIETLEPTQDDRERVERHRQAFMLEVEGVGIPRELCPGFWNHDDGLIKLRIGPRDAFDQTPGPDAGRPL